MVFISQPTLALVSGHSLNTRHRHGRDYQQSFQRPKAGQHHTDWLVMLSRKGAKCRYTSSNSNTRSGRLHVSSLMFEDQNLPVQEGPSEEDLLKQQQISEATEVAANAIQLPPGVSAEDLKAFYDILQAGSYEAAQEAVAALAAQGQLTEAVAEAGVLALNQAREKGALPGLVQTLESVVELLIVTLQQGTASPTLKLVDELITLKPSQNKQLVSSRLTLALEADTFTREDFIASMKAFFQQMDMQDQEFADHVESVWEEATEEEKDELTQMTAMRRDARIEMTAVLEIAEELEE